MDKLKHKIQDMYDQSDPPIFFFKKHYHLTNGCNSCNQHTPSFSLFRGSNMVKIYPPSLLYVLYARDWLNKMGLIVIDELVHDVCVCMFGGCLPFLEIRPILRQKVSRFSTPINSAAKPRETA